MDLSEIATKYPSLSCALSTSSIVISILLYFLSSAAKETNLVRQLIHLGCLANNCLNDSAGLIGTFSSTVIVLSSAPSSLYVVPPAVVWIWTGTLYFVGWYSAIVSTHVSCVFPFVRSNIFHSL